VVRLLLARADVEVNSKDRHGRTPLSRAAENGHNGVVRMLDGHGQTPLSMAAGGKGLLTAGLSEASVPKNRISESDSESPTNQI
jgi:hypothetical protein